MKGFVKSKMYEYQIQIEMGEKASYYMMKEYHGPKSAWVQTNKIQADSKEEAIEKLNLSEKRKLVYLIELGPVWYCPKDWRWDK